MINGRKDTYDLVKEKVLEFYDSTHPQDVVVFFEQRYASGVWEKLEVLVEFEYSYTSEPDRMTFQWDFCEGQTEARNIVVVPFDEILNYYRENVIEKENDNATST